MKQSLFHYSGKRNGLERKEEEMLPKQQTDKRGLSPGQKYNLRKCFRSSLVLTKIKREWGGVPLDFLDF